MAAAGVYVRPSRASPAFPINVVAAYLFRLIITSRFQKKMFHMQQNVPWAFVAVIFDLCCANTSCWSKPLYDIFVILLTTPGELNPYFPMTEASATHLYTHILIHIFLHKIWFFTPWSVAETHKKQRKKIILLLIHQASTEQRRWLWWETFL